MEHGHVQLLLREAIASAKSGNKSWARDCLGRILRADPYNEEAWLWMSSVLETAAEKRYCLERVLAINPDNAQAQAGLRYLQQQSEAPVRAAEPLRTICPMCGEPNDPHAFQCANCGQDLFVLCPSCGERVDIDRTSCAKCGLEVGDSSNGAAYFFHLGELYLQHNQPKRALETWDKTLLLNPDYPRVAEVAAEAFMASNQRDLALQSLQRAIEEAKDEQQRRKLRLRLASYYRDIGNMEEASRLYKELLQEDQEKREPQADIYTELGRFYQQNKDRDAARHYYEMALALDEDLYDVHYALAEVFLQEGYELRALNEFRWLQSVGGPVAEKATAQIQALRPAIPEEFRNRWRQTIRGTARFFLVGFFLLLLTTGRDWNSVTVGNAVGLFLFLIGGYFVTAATATPRNLPSLANLARLAEGPLAVRLRARRKKDAISARPSLLRRFVTWQARSARKIVAGLQVTWMRTVQLLHRLAARSAQSWEKLKMSRAAQSLRRFLAALAKKPFFQAVARFFRRTFPYLARSALFQRMGQVVRGGGRRLAERAGKVEITEAQLSRWIAAVVGLLLLGLAVFLVLP